MKKIYFSTGNPFKLKNAKKHLGDIFDVHGIDLHTPEPQSLDQKYVAEYKLREAFEKLNSPVFVEDLGLYINKFNQFPGVITAYVLKGIGLDGIKKLINENEPAFYQTTVAYKDENLEIFVTTKMEGHLTIANMSKNFHIMSPFKSMFVPNGHEVPIADLSQKEQELLDYNKKAYCNFKKELLKNKII